MAVINRMIENFLSSLYTLRQNKWIRPRWAILAGMVLLGLLLVALGIGSSLASTDQSVSSLQHQKDLISPQEYQFTGQGKLTGGSAETWVIGGVPIVTGDLARTEGRIQPGDTISLVGHITKNGAWVAERISVIDETSSFFSFAGPLESKSDDAWQVAGITLAIDEKTILGNGIPLGELVLATFQVQPDDTWLALEIQAISALEKARTPTTTPTPTITPSPTATNTPPSSPTGGTSKDLTNDKTQKSPPSNNDTSSQSDLVTVCHKPNSKNGGKTVTLERSALSGHLNHGDTLGSCR